MESKIKLKIYIKIKIKLPLPDRAIIHGTLPAHSQRDKLKAFAWSEIQHFLGGFLGNLDTKIGDGGSILQIGNFRLRDTFV